MTFILQSKEWQKFSRIWLDIAFACLLTVLSGFSPSTLAAPGDLDMSFGGSGKVTTNSPMTAVAQSLLLQPDGKFVAAGFASSGGLMKFALARFLPGGSLDTGFGTGGLLNTTFGSLESWINAMALQADGKIICAGAVSAGSNWGIALARYHSDGTLDTTFGTGGLVTTAIGGSSAANAVAVRPDGKILVAGWGYGGAGQFVLLRYNQDGSLDTSFGSGGIVLTAVGSAASASSMVIQPDGKIVLAGSGYAGANEVFALTRYDSDGNLDPGFGTGGIVATPLGSTSHIYSIALQADGKIVAGGLGTLGGSSQWHFALARYNPNGSLDTGFGSNGTVITVLGVEDVIHAVLIQPNGKIVTAGYSELLNGPSSTLFHFALARYQANGSLDLGFGTGGTVITVIDPSNYSTYDRAYAAVLQPDGKIVAAGTSLGFALVRYLGDPPLPANIPSLSPWALGMLALLIAGVAAWRGRCISA